MKDVNGSNTNVAVDHYTTSTSNASAHINTHKDASSYNPSTGLHTENQKGRNQENIAFAPGDRLISSPATTSVSKGTILDPDTYMASVFVPSTANSPAKNSPAIAKSHKYDISGTHNRTISLNTELATTPTDEGFDAKGASNFKDIKLKTNGPATYLNTEFPPRLLPLFLRVKRRNFRTMMRIMKMLKEDMRASKIRHYIHPLFETHTGQCNWKTYILIKQ